jgi:cell division septal protein FtsQ
MISRLFSSRGRKLRKQPRMRRMQAATWVASPRIGVPATAQKRRKRNSRRFSLPLAGIGRVLLSARWLSSALLAVCIFALFLIGEDDNFYLTSVPVEGISAVSAREIVEASGLGGAHIFAANPAEAAANVNQVPGIISATVTLHWPNQVLIQVSEDTPVAVWEQAGRLYWINAHGRLVPARRDVPELLHIYSEWPEPPDDFTFVSDDVLDGALQLVELRSNIDKLYYHPSGGLSYQDGRGWRGYFGVGTNMAQKLVVYETIVDDLVARGITPEYISVSNQARPFYKRRG